MTKRFYQPLILLFIIPMILLGYTNCGEFKAIDALSVEMPSFAQSDGKMLYKTSCAGCHGSLEDSTKKNKSVAQLQAAIASVPSMSGLKSLSADDLSSIVSALNVGVPVAPTHTCETNQANLAASNPLRRLPSVHYINTLNSIFGKAYDGAGNSLYKDAAALISVHPYDSLAKSGAVFDNAYNSALAKSQVDIANAISTAASSSSAKAVSIGMTASCYATPTAACVKTFISVLGKRLLRRALSTGELDSFYTQYYSQGSTNAEKLQALVMGLMLDPEHLMVFEIGNDTVVAGEVKLSSYEVATRLSFMLLGDTPDDALLTAADNSAVFLTPAGLQAQIDRLIQTPKFVDNMDRFLQYWLPADPKSGFPADLPASYFGDSDLADSNKRLANSADLRRDAADFLTGIIQNDLGYKELITANIAFPKTATAAKVYGLLPAAATGAMANVTHRGLMQRPAYLLNSNGNSNPIYRGKFMLVNVLCRDIGSPANFADVAAAPELDPVFNSTRKVIEVKTAGSACIGCHSQFNHFGFALEAFDGLGRYRQNESFFLKSSIFTYRTTCNPNDTSIVGYNDPRSDNYCPTPKPPYTHPLDMALQAQFDLDRSPASINGPAEFANALATSAAASTCMSVKLHRFTSLKAESAESSCDLNDTEVRAHDNTQSLKTILFGKYKQPRFLSRKVVQ